MSMERHLDYQFKIAFVGSASVGKTSTILRFTTNTFRDNYIPTLGVGFAKKMVSVQEKRASLQIWDMGAQDHLGKIRANYFGGARGVVFVYDITKQETFDELINWKEEVDEHLSGYSILVAANKLDLKTQRKVSSRKGNNLAKKFDGKYIEISAKTGEKVEDAFQLIASLAITKLHEEFDLKD
jgi:small GTP-binding protein